MPDARRPDESVQEEIRDQADAAPLDDETVREGLELDLMEHDASDEGEHIGEQID